MVAGCNGNKQDDLVEATFDVPRETLDDIE